MGIQKITQLATNVLSKVQKMPLPKQLGLVALATTGVFGLGVAVGETLFGDSFEKEQPVQEEQSKTNEPEVPTDNAETKPEFEYTPPTVGKLGIASADTLYSAKTQKIACIEYKNSNNEVVHQTHYDENNNMKEFTVFGNNDDSWTYNKDGKCISSLVNYDDGSYIYRYDNSVSDGYREYDKEGRLTSERDTWKDPWKWTAIDYEYDSKGGRVEKILNRDKESNKHNYYDKNDRLVKSKQFDSSKQLLYTVTPKYDEDGDIVKRDTVWVNK